MMSEPVLIATDLMRHEPVTVRVISSLEHRYLQHKLSSRYIRMDGMILEIEPPVEGTTPFPLGGVYEFRVKLPHQDVALALTGNIHKVIPLGQDSEGNQMTILGVRFVELTHEARQALEAHELAVAAEEGIERSPRIPVRFQVELKGMDVMSPLMARDLSMSGIFVSGKAKFTPGKLLTLQFLLPFQRKEVALRGKVIWAGEKPVADSAEQCAGFGVAFMDTPPVTRAALAKYYARNTIEY